jgi:hypothetical protein
VTTPPAKADDDNRYSGWAPCTCHKGPEVRDQMRAELLPAGATIAAMLFELNLHAGSVTIASDMWWGVSVKGCLHTVLDGEKREDDVVLGDKREFSTYIQADEVDMALIETWRQWCAKYREVSGHAPIPRWEES